MTRPVLRVEVQVAAFAAAALLVASAWTWMTGSALRRHEARSSSQRTRG